jgi:DNA-binding transcriptional ArsR family regulator
MPGPGPLDWRGAGNILNQMVEHESHPAPGKALDLAFAALADPTRRRIVQRLADGDARVTDLAEPFSMSLNAVSKHLKVLERAGLVKRRRAGREHHIALEGEPIRQVARWASEYERFWTERLDDLEAYLHNEPKGE